MTKADAPSADPESGHRVVIKKYANRRLYNTATSTYVTLEHLAEMVRQGTDFVVYDAKTGEDITRGVLAQIIFEEESRGENLLPLQFLRQLIRFYGDSMQSFLPGYLEMSLDGFAKRREEMRQQFPAVPAAAEALEAYQAQVRQNLALFDNAMKMFTPFGMGAAAKPAAAEADKAAPETPLASDPLAEMRRQMEAMQQQIRDLAAKK
ncbi:MAG: polyhydroxyalkanoate synthesis repressor PhaR [Caulobacteraceae bacterium]